MVKRVDLRSDTVTQPTEGMRRAIARAVVGDDVFGEDPTVNRLQEMVAEILGKEAALFVPSGTMANQVAIKSLTQPGDELICEASSHCYNFEGGGLAFNSGVQVYPIPGRHGVITAEEVENAVRAPYEHYPRTRVVAIENTHNHAGGTVFPLDEILRIRAVADRHGLLMHMDGARLWNASAATGISPADFARPFDTVCVCLSKGLGAPVGSVVASTKERIAQIRRYRRILGGGMRQVGILAAAGIYALEHHRDRLVEDHRRARRLAEALAELPGFELDLQTVQTNIVIVAVTHPQRDERWWVEALAAEGVLALPFGRRRLRFVTHLDVDDEGIDYAIRTLRKLAQS
ncbi:MAG: aminotransferase class I/II-fold pyridoxal phosphate-dependent enzyme [candidate division KSB1 bacterium]|nr:aminotransferase class I/II-fold pyridoxal phosphate-dependent enzyme [candidate division KSB1 bacterium]